ncbi:MAG: hypothetical protein JNK88_07325, partial [Mangrovicoccus sp.]|nr:hypothetical protein [Mangrovicoccus sp.]
MFWQQISRIWLMQRVGRAPDQRPGRRRPAAATLFGSLLVMSVCCASLPPKAVASPPADPATGAPVAASGQQTGENASMTTITVSNASQLQAAFASAKDGDRIELAAGKYGNVQLAGRSFATGVTIASADSAKPAVLESLNLDKVAGLDLADITIDPTGFGQNGSKTTRLLVTNSRDLDFSGLSIEGHIPTTAEGVNPKAKSTQRDDAIAG